LELGLVLRDGHSGVAVRPGRRWDGRAREQERGCACALGCRRAGQPAQQDDHCHQGGRDGGCCWCPVGGKSYPTIQFESDIGGSSALCNTATGVGCTVPPISAKFYPFWSLSSLFSLGGHTAGCVWNFGNDQPNTLNDFGKDAQYGTPNIARYGGTIISAPMPNPTLSRSCL
jgi:hypothetical protein